MFAVLLAALTLLPSPVAEVTPASTCPAGSFTIINTVPPLCI
jgi:hypothetical protein